MLPLLKFLTLAPVWPASFMIFAAVSASITTASGRAPATLEVEVLSLSPLLDFFFNSGVISFFESSATLSDTLLLILSTRLSQNPFFCDDWFMIDSVFCFEALIYPGENTWDWSWDILSLLSLIAAYEGRAMHNEMNIAIEKMIVALEYKVFMGISSFYYFLATPATSSARLNSLVNSFIMALMRSSKTFLLGSRYCLRYLGSC